MTELHNAVIDYKHNGRIYSVYIPCESEAEAHDRLKSLKQTGRVEGWPCFKISTNPITFPFARIWLQIKVWLFEMRRQ